MACSNHVTFAVNAVSKAHKIGIKMTVNYTENVYHEKSFQNFGAGNFSNRNTEEIGLTKLESGHAKPR